MTVAGGTAIKKYHYINSPTGLCAIFVMEDSSSKKLYHIFTDHLGSLTEIVDDSTNTVTKQSFDAWGNPRSVTDWRNTATYTLFADRGFTGHEHLEEFELINMNGRVYDPVLGRFLSPDPYVQQPDFSQSFNRYSYCLNNPLIYTDPSGMRVLPGEWEWRYGERQNKHRLHDMDGGGYNVTIEFDFKTYRIVPTTETIISSDGNPIDIYLPGVEIISTNFSYTISIFGGPGRGNDLGYYPYVANNPSGGGGWLTATDHTNNGIGGFGAGMSNLGGNFRMNNSNGFSPKFYTKPNAAGKIFNGGFGIKTYNTTNWGKGIGYGSLGVSFVIGGIDVTNGWQQDGHTYGANTQMALAQSSLGITGAWAGAEIGAAIGVWFGGVGAIPGAVIGGVIGGVVGGWGGSKLGETVVNNFSSY